MPDRLAQKVLLIGWDAADWRIIRPLLAAGRMPHLAKLVAEGSSGNLASLRPMLSPMLWTSVATGKRPHKHGIHGFTEPRPEGDGIRAVASTSRTTKAIWNILAQRGLRAQCVNWYASHPAEPINGVCISDRFAVTPPAPGAAWPLADGAVHPPDLSDLFAELRVRPEEMDASTLLPFVPDAARIDQAHDKRLLALAVILARTATTHGAITWCLEHRQWDFAAVLYNGIDQFCHLFMPYHPPRRADVSEADFELYRGVVTAAYQFHDMMLGRLLQLAGDDATVMIVSDHGYRTAPARPTDAAEAAQARTLEALSLEHRPQGICVMRGPHVRAGETIEGASLLDVTPTVLTLLALPVAGDMDGRAWVEVIDSPKPPVDRAFLRSWDDVSGDAGLHSAELRHESPAESLEAVRHLIALGYVDPPDEDVRAAIERTLAENRFNLARSLLDARQPDQAIALLERLVRDQPAHAGYNAALFEAYHLAGRTADGRRIAEAMWARGHRGPLAHLAMAAVHLAERKPDGALQHVEEAERLSPGLPGLHVLAGRAWLRLRQWDRAAAAFEAALCADGDDESALHGLACATLGKGEDEPAAGHALRAISLREDYAEAHYHLGVALSRLGRAREAETALRRCLSLRPGLLAAYGRLAELYEQPGGALNDVHRARECRQRANEIILLRRRRRLAMEQARAASAPSSAGAVRPPVG